MIYEILCDFCKADRHHVRNPDRRRQHKALSTEDTYIFWLRRYMIALREMPGGFSSEQKLERFLTDLARYCDVSASTQNQRPNLSPANHS